MTALLCVQAAAFPEMVLAVATRVESARMHFSCGHTPRYLDPTEVTREVLAGILQSGEY